MAAFPLWAWIAFGVFIVFMLALDLFVLHQEAKEISFSEAAILSALWVALALHFMLADLTKRFVYLSVGHFVMLVFVGVKVIVSDIFGKVPIWVSLPFITTVVRVSIVASLWKTRGQRREALPGQ
jgi:predicted tellurium resistance membrane protein TerC